MKPVQLGSLENASGTSSLSGWRSPLVRLLAFGALLIAIWLPRGTSLDRYATIDEARWLLRSANFYQALVQGDLANTFQREHPGVTITWAGAAAFAWRYPEYAHEAGEQMAGHTRFQRFLKQHKHSPLDLLSAGRFFVAAAITASLACSFFLVIRLMGFYPALLGFLLIAFDPFLVSLSRLLHLDGLVSALMLLSLLAFMDYLYRGRRRSSLLLSGAAAGLSWLTKSPALFLAPFIFLLVLADAIRSHLGLKNLSMRAVWPFVRPFLGWFGIAAAVFVLLWPAMWVDPLGSLQRMFSQALEYAVEGNRNALFFNGQIYPSGASAWYYYPVAYLWRATPATLIGLGWAFLALIFRRRLGIPRLQLDVISWLLVFAALYTVFMSLGGQKYDRYLLPILAPLGMVAGWGWIILLQHVWLRFANGLPRRAARLAAVALVGVVLLMQVLGVVETHPYYYTYFNPMLGGLPRAARVMMLGWGEGLDQAARYLNSLPRAGGLRAITWYGDACFSYFFKGITTAMPEDVSLEELQEADYVVLYVQQVQRQLPSAVVLEYFARLAPEYTVRLGGLEYAWVYNMRGMHNTVP